MKLKRLVYISILTGLGVVKKKGGLKKTVMNLNKYSNIIIGIILKMNYNKTILLEGENNKDQERLIEALKEEYTTRLGEYVELLIDIYHMNSLIIAGMFILLNVFIAINIKGHEDKILKYIYIIKKGKNMEKWLKWYIDKWIKSSIFVFILVWISLMFGLWVIKYLIFKYILS